MAKRGKRKRLGKSTEAKIEGFAEDLGRLLGTAEAKANSWLGQRQQIAKTLVGIRDTASGLLSQLGHEASTLMRRRPGRPPKNAASASGTVSGRPRRKVSAKTRAAMSKAQQARWAKIRAQEGGQEKPTARRRAKKSRRSAAPSDK
jgi:hypothetical protein